MMSIIYIFWMYVILFAVIGMMRGWAKELLVIFSVVTALAVNLLLERYIPLVRDLDKTSTSVFWTRVIILGALVYFGYQTVNFSRFQAGSRREKLQDNLFGAVLGAVNGYLIAGSVLYYIHVANYPYPKVISPALDPTIAEVVNRMMAVMPPRFLGEPGIYFAVIIILIFIIVVYI